MSRAVFLDRDGVINEIAYFPELGLLDSPLNPKQFKFLPQVAEAIGVFNRLGLKVIVVSNQPAIAKGKMTMNAFGRIRLKMRNELEKKGAHIDAEYYCFHHPSAKNAKYKGNCDCRKPKPGLFLRAAKDFGLDLSKCYAVGDSLTDVKAGKAVGCQTFLIGYLKCDMCKFMHDEDAKPDLIVPSLFAASKIIEKEISGSVKPNLMVSKVFHTPQIVEKEMNGNGNIP
jgi:D-glycero-D-manno-heptose 1,7-bisphosphate phosphatase